MESSERSRGESRSVARSKARRERIRTTMLLGREPEPAHSRARARDRHDAGVRVAPRFPQFLHRTVDNRGSRRSDQIGRSPRSRRTIATAQAGGDPQRGRGAKCGAGLRMKRSGRDNDVRCRHIDGKRVGYVLRDIHPTARSAAQRFGEVRRNQRCGRLKPHV